MNQIPINQSIREINRVAILTSGGDAPGMNAAIRAITLACLKRHIEVYGFKHGYNGLLNDEWLSIDEHQVRQIIHCGGTILKSARCAEFPKTAAAQRAAEILNKHQIDCLFVIGGEGSFKGAVHLGHHWDGQIIGLPGTIDNDIDGSDSTIGYHTAMDTALDAIDKIRDTADAFERIFIVEVMGREAGFLALNVGIASGAEQIICPEFYPVADQTVSLATIASHIEATRNQRRDASYIMVLAENYWPGGAVALAATLSAQLGIDCRPCVLGYIQRGGRPVSNDRILATKLGVAAVEAALDRRSGIMVGQVNGEIIYYPLTKTADQNKSVDRYLLAIQQNDLSD